MTDLPRLPSSSVQAAFGASGPAVPLSGGLSTPYRYGDIVLKPLDLSPGALRWQAEALPRIANDPAIRVAPPLSAEGGQYVVDGWTAWPFLLGTSTRTDWAAVLAAGRAFHSAVAGEPRPSFVAERTDHWARADRMAWGEETPPVSAARHPVVTDMVDIVRAAPSGPQRLVHLDLTGNVLLHPTLAPAVIDVSAYWRPTGYAEAVVVTDALTWHSADPSLATRVERADLARALLFRVVTDLLGEPDRPLSRRYSRVLGLLRPPPAHSRAEPRRCRRS